MAIKDKRWDVRSALRREDKDSAAADVPRATDGVRASAPAGEPVKQSLHDGPHSIMPHKNARHDIKRTYGVTLQIGLLLSLALILGFFKAPMRGSGEFEITLVEQEHVQMEEIRQTKQEVRPPPPPRPPVPIEVPNDEILEDIELNLDASLDIDEPISQLPPPPPAAPTVKAEDAVDEHEIFVIVEQMPEIIGGTEEIYKYLSYPELARKAGLEGLVVVQVVVETDGRPTNPSVVRSPGAILDDAAVRAVMQLKFKPGMQRGKPVRVRFALPVRFRLSDR